MQKSQLSPSTLAFVGDAYFGLLTRLKLAETERPIKELHRRSVKVVNANAQATGFDAVKNILTEEELSVFKRGRNSHTSHTPKNSSVAQYHTATGLECLFGYLIIDKQQSRAKELFDIIWQEIEKTDSL